MNPQDPMQPQQQPQQPSYGGLPPLSQPQPSASPSVAPRSPSSYQPVQAQASGQQPQVDYIGGPSQQDRQEYSIDYLNRIAPKEQKTVNKFAVFGLIGGLLLAVIFAVVLMSSSGGPSANTQIATVASRVATIQAVVTEQQKHLNSTEMSESNAALGSTFSTMNTDISAIMKERKIKADNALTAKEKAYKEALSKTLNDSYQKGTLDRTYATQMTYELTFLRSQIAKLKKASTSTSIRSFCDNGTENIDLILKSYAAYDASKS